MNNKSLIHLSLCLALIVLGCTKSNSDSQMQAQSAKQSVSGNGKGMTQFSGVGFLAETADCNSSVQGAAFAVKMTGDLVGCLYVFVDHFECSPSGTYREEGREYFVGTFNGGEGTFRTTYKVEAKYEGCAADGSYLGAEIFGRCQHPFVEGSGTGTFAGVTGQFDMTDDVVVPKYPYKGHLKF